MTAYEAAQETAAGILRKFEKHGHAVEWTDRQRDLLAAELLKHGVNWVTAFFNLRLPA